MKLWISGLILGCTLALRVVAQTAVLTYNGAPKGDWFAAGAWLNESGASVNWQDGAIAVITNKDVTLTNHAYVYGFDVTMTGRYCVYGNGTLTIGAGGITKNGASGEFNIQNAGGIVLAASQTWNAPVGGMICLDGMKPLTASNGVVLSAIGGTTALRMNTAGGLSEATTVYVSTNAYLSFSSSSYLSSGAVVLDGAGTRLSADLNFMLGSGRVGNRLLLRNGASLSLATATATLPVIDVDAPATQATSVISGTSLTLGRAWTEFAISNNAVLQLTIPLYAIGGTNAALRKTGSGVLQLNAANSFPGGVAVDAGLLRVMHAAGAGTGPVALAAGTTLDWATTGIFSNVVSGAGTVVKSSAGSLTIQAVNAYTGNTVLSNGTTRIASLASLGSGSVTLGAGASLVFAASQTLGSGDMARITGMGTVLAGAGAEIVWSGDYAVSSSIGLDAEVGGTMVVGQLTGSGYIKTGTGKLRIAGTTGYSGEIVVSAGVLNIGSTTNLAEGVTVRTTGSGIVQVDSLAAQDWTTITGTRAIALAAGTSVELNTDTLAVPLTTVTNETWTITGLTGSTDLIKTGWGTVAVSNAVAFAGKVYVIEGTLRAIGALGTSQVTVSNGTFAAYGSGTTLQNSYSVVGGTLQADAGGSLGAGVIALLPGATVAATNGGSLGSGTLLLTNTTLRMDVGGSAGTRAITLVNGGTIQVYEGAGFDAATLAIAGGTLDFRTTTTMGRGIALSANATFNATTPAGAPTPTIATLAGLITTPVRSKLAVNGNGQLRLAGGGTFSGGGEIFVQGTGDLTIVSNEVVVTGYAGLESGGKRFAVADGGTFSMTGNNVKLHAGMGGGNCLFEVLTGGVYSVSAGVDLLIGNGGTTTLRICGGTMTVANLGQFALGLQSTTSTGVIELVAGGVLKTSRQIKTGPGFGLILFAGGTLQSDGVNSYDPWISTNIAMSLPGAESSIDPQGLAMKLGTAGISGPGALTVIGGGSVSFARPSTNWNGRLTLAHGQAVVSTHRALGTSSVTLGTNALRIEATAFLPNAINATTQGAVWVSSGVTGFVGTVSGDQLIKAGAGNLIVDDCVDGMDISIREGAVTATLQDEIPHAPAGNLVIWMDASVAASLVTVTSNDVSRWYDRRYAGNANGFFATNIFNRPLIVSNRLNGLPMLDFGRLGQGGGSGDNRMLQFKNYQANIRTVFWVIGSRNGGGFLLGDNQANGSERHFHRGSGSGTYGGVASDPIWGGSGQDKGIVRAGETWTNGVSVNGVSTGLSGTYDLVTWRLSSGNDASNKTPGAIWFASCYADPGGRLNGGQELGEVLIYTNRLSDAEVSATERYLTRKWFPASARARIALGSVALDGGGAGFVNAYAAPVQMTTLTVNSTNVYIAGTAGGTAASQTVVTAAGILGPTVTSAVALNHLNLQSAATLEAAFGTTGIAPVVALAGDLNLPDSARFLVTGSVRPPESARLITVGGVIVQSGGTTRWSNAGTTSYASAVIVDDATRTVWLKTPRGSLVILR